MPRTALARVLLVALPLWALIALASPDSTGGEPPNARAIVNEERSIGPDPFKADIRPNSGAGLTAACAVGAIWLAGRVFRVGMLRYGQRVRVREVWQGGRGE